MDAAKAGGGGGFVLLGDQDHSSAHSHHREALEVDYNLEKEEDEDADGSTVQEGALIRRVTFFDAYCCVVGIMIGSGIFSSPGVSLLRAGSPGCALVAWAFSGILVIMTASCYFELAGLYPAAGGDFTYLQNAFGERAGFAFAWFNFWISKTGSQAIIATIFGRYVEQAAHIVAASNSHAVSSTTTVTVTVTTATTAMEETPLSKGLAVALIVVITLLNICSVKESTWLQNTLTCLKIALIVLIFVAAVISISTSSSSSSSSIAHNNLSPGASFEGSRSPPFFFYSLVSCLWGFDGWADVNFLTEELLFPSQLPHIVTLAVITVTCVYLLANVSYLLVLDLQTIKSSYAIGAQFGSQISTGGSIAWPLTLAIGVAVSTAGSVHGSIFTGARAFYAVAREGKAPKFLSKVSSIGSPVGALIGQGSWTVVLLCLPGSSFETLLAYFGPASWAFYAFGCAAVIRLRYTQPHAKRPFKVPFYPFTPLFVIFLAVCIVISSISESPLYCLLALAFILLSFPFHYFWFELKLPPSQALASAEEGEGE